MAIGTETSTGWKRTAGGTGMWRRDTFKDIDIGTSTADIIPAQVAEGTSRLRLSFRNDAPNTVTLTILTTSQDPSSTHDSEDWDQQPDISTTYTVGSPGASDDGRRELALLGPFKYWKLRAAIASAASTGSFDVYADYLG